MLDAVTFNKFISAANKSHQQLCVWFLLQNHFALHQNRWNEYSDGGSFAIENFNKKNGCKYKNLFSVTIASTQHGWILGTARLFDPAYHPKDRRKEKSRLSLDYILEELGDEDLKLILKLQLEEYKDLLDSLKKLRNNVLAHNDTNFNNSRIEAGVENLYEWLERTVETIKKKPHLTICNTVNVKYNEKLSQCGAGELFETLLIGERNEGS